MKNILIKLGLEDKEAEIYIACSIQDISNPTDLHKQTGIKRSTIYFYLEKLKEKGLITLKVKGGRKYIECLPHKDAFKKYIAHKKAKIAEEEQLIEKLKINAPNNVRGPETRIYYHEGEEGIWLLMDKILSGKKDIYWLGSINLVLDSIKESKVYQQFTLKRMTQNTSSFAITDKRILDHERFSEKLGDFRFFRFLDKNFDTPAFLVLFGNSVCLISKTGSEIKTVIIEDTQMYKIIYFLFNGYWQSLPESEF